MTAIDHDIDPPDEACQLLKQAVDLLYYGADGESLFTSVLIVGCYSGQSARTGELQQLSAACMQTRHDRPESAARLLARLREVVADLEHRVAGTEGIQQMQRGGDA